jgi:hypothetical protein
MDFSLSNVTRSGALKSFLSTKVALWMRLYPFPGATCATQDRWPHYPSKWASVWALSEDELKVLTPVLRQIEQAGANRLGAIPAFGPFHIASR